MKSFRYKDRHPDDTVANIFDILTSLEQIVEVEIHYTRTFYSAKLSLKDTNISVEGKGGSIPFCLASAFGEMYERLINLVPFKLTSNALYNYDTVPYPYALLSATKYQECFHNFISQFGISKSLSEQLFDLLTHYESYGNLTTHLLEMRSSTECYSIPTRLIDLLYGTNGMSTGNSKHEALCQSFCEIIERHYLYKLLHNKIRLYKVTDRIMMSDTYANSINDFKLNGLEIDIYLIPNSIGVSICVIAISYPSIEHIFCKVGVHPIETFAIERTFTELFQNRSIASIKSQLEDNQRAHIDYTSLENFLNICRNDNGFFSKKILESCTQTCHSNIIYDNYSEACAGIIEYFYKHNYHIYYCFYEFHDMYTYHVIIPQYSELVSPIEISSEMINYNLKILTAKSLLSRIRKLNIEEYTKLHQILSTDSTIIPLLTSDYSKDCPMNSNVNLDNLKTLLFSYCEKKIVSSEQGNDTLNALYCEKLLPYDCLNCSQANTCNFAQTNKKLLDNLLKILSQNAKKTTTEAYQ